MTKKIFVPVDLNDQAKAHSQAMLKTATELAKALNWKISVFHAFTIPLAPPNKEGGAYISHATEAKEQKQQIKQLLAEVPEVDSVLNEVMIEQGGAQELICDIAKKKGADLILMGTKARHGLQSKLLGSISEYVIRHAHCPVMVVPEQAPVGSPQRINLLVDENNIEDISQLELLTELAGSLTPKLTVTYVSEAQQDDLETLEIYKYLREQSPGGIQTSCQSLIESDPASTKGILKDWSQDSKILIAMPFHQEGLLEQLFTPSLMTKLVNQAQSPMLILK